MILVDELAVKVVQDTAMLFENLGVGKVTCPHFISNVSFTYHSKWTREMEVVTVTALKIASATSSHPIFNDFMVHRP